MKKDNAILIGLVVAVAGFLGYRYYKKKKDKKDTESNAAEETKPTQTTGYPGPNTGPTSFAKKVMELQSFLGVAIDGIPGPQTNGAWARRAPATFAKYGPINSANIDFYVALIKGPANLIL